MSAGGGSEARTQARWLSCVTLEAEFGGPGRGPHGQRSTESPSWTVAEALRFLKCRVPEILLGALPGAQGTLMPPCRCPVPPIPWTQGVGTSGSSCRGWGWALSVCPPAGPSASVPWLHWVGERALPCSENSIFYGKAKRGVRACGFLEKEPEERKEEQPERVQKQRRASRQALWARRGLPQNTHQKVPFRLQGCVCVCV